MRCCCCAWIFGGGGGITAHSCHVHACLPFRCFPSFYCGSALPWQNVNLIHGLQLFFAVGMGVLRGNHETLMSVLESFLHDPLVEWGRSKRGSSRNLDGTWSVCSYICIYMYIYLCVQSICTNVIVYIIHDIFIISSKHFIVQYTIYQWRCYKYLFHLCPLFKFGKVRLCYSPLA